MGRNHGITIESSDMNEQSKDLNAHISKDVALPTRLDGHGRNTGGHMLSQTLA